MRHCSALQNKLTKKWKYTAGWARDGRIIEIGFCADDDGHDTEEEACACYRKYLLEKRCRLHEPQKNPTSKHRCAVEDCEEYTAGYAVVATYWMKHLCDKHRTVEVVESLFGPVGESWES